MTTDVCVPISDLPGALRHAREAIETRGLDGAILGHVGDGNYHALFPVDAQDQTDMERAEAVNEEIVAYALARGGTCTGEHGVGSGKIEHWRESMGLLAVHARYQAARRPKRHHESGQDLLRRVRSNDSVWLAR